MNRFANNLLVLLLTIAMMLSVVPHSVFAAGNIEMTITPSVISTNTGSDVDFTISMKSTAGTNLRTIEFYIVIPDGMIYKAASGKLTGAFEGIMTMFADFTETPKLMVSGMRSNAYNGEGIDIATFTCTANEVGTKNVTLENIEITDTAYETINTNITVGTVNVTSPLYFPNNPPSKSDGGTASSGNNTSQNADSSMQTAGSSSGIPDDNDQENSSLLLVIDSITGYVSGYPDGTIRPKGNITRYETAVMFYNLISDDNKIDYKAYISKFNDVPDEQWYSEAVGYLAAAGVLRGYEDDSFRGGNTITRAEFVAIASKFNKTNVSGNLPFSDVEEKHWAYDFILSAYNNGWISGYPDGSFGLNRMIQRAEAFTIANRLLGWKTHSTRDEKRPTDLTGDEWYFQEVMLAVNGELSASIS